MIFWYSVGEKLVEYVVVSLGRLLEGDTRLFQQIRLDVSASDFASWSKVDTDKFALCKKTLCIHDLCV